MASTPFLDPLFSDLLKFHSRNSPSRKELGPPALKFAQNNRSCGDRVGLEFLTDQDGKVLDAAWSGDGCSVCCASASLLCEAAIGSTVLEMTSNAEMLLQILHSEDEAFCAALAAKLAAAGTIWTSILKLAELRAIATRIPCAALAWEALCKRGK